MSGAEVSPDVSLIRDRLRSLEPRDGQALILRLVDGRSRAECAGTYGISVEAFDIKLWRALAGYVASNEAALVPQEDERRRAAALGQVLESDPEAGLQDRELLAAARALQACAPALRAALDAAAREEELSPARRREDVLRRVIVVAIIALTAFFYFRSHP